jgi:hypothetical protein
VVLLGLAAALASSAGLAPTAPGLATSGGATPFTYTAPNHYPSLVCGNPLDPVTSTNALTLFPDGGSRGYNGIGSVTVGAANTVSASTPTVGQESFDVTLCGPVPRLPHTSTTHQIDTGLELRVCVSPNSVIATAPEYIYTDHFGGGHYDGPYPGSQGYRYCAFVRVAVGVSGNTVTWGTGIWDPAFGLVRAQDETTLHDVAGVNTIATPTADVGSVGTGFVGATVIRFYLPSSVVYTAEGTVPGQILKDVVEPFLVSGSTVNNWSVTVALSSYGSQSLQKPEAVTDSAPGVEFCLAAGTCAADFGASYDYGLQPGGSPVNPANGVASCALNWNYFPELPVNSWLGVAGQGGWPTTCNTMTAKSAYFYQDRGDCAQVGPPLCANPDPATPQAASFRSAYGRGPNALVNGYAHQFAQYNSVPGNFYYPAP